MRRRIMGPTSVVLGIFTVTDREFLRARVTDLYMPEPVFEVVRRWVDD